MKLKRFLSLLLVVMMLAAMFVTSASAAGVSITISDERAGRTYVAYQIFSGSLDATKGVLSDVEWGKSINGETFLAALKSSELFEKSDGTNYFAGSSTAAEVAGVLGSWSYNEILVKNFAHLAQKHLGTVAGSCDQQTEGKYVIPVEAVGYYLVKDTKSSDGSGAVSDLLLYVTTNEAVAPKISAPTFKKTVNNVVDGTYMEAIDAQVGDMLYFKLETKLPVLYNDYMQYRMIMEDTLPEGLEFNAIEDVYILHASGNQDSYKAAYENHAKMTGHTTTFDMTTAHDKEFYYDDDHNKLWVNFGDLKITQPNRNLNDSIVVKYSAMVTDEAVFGLGRYGVDHDENAMGNTNKAVLHFSNNMNEENADAAKLDTLEDHAHVYLYQLEVNKQDMLTGAPLTGAQFVLYRNITEKVTESGKEVEVLVPHYAMLREVTETVGESTVKYNVITGWTTDKKQAGVMDSSENAGTFIVQGLDSLAYHLEEVQPPTGYNTMKEPVLVTLQSSIVEHELKSISCTADSTTSTGTINDGKVSIVVKNTAGTQLPETGGTGTTIFYVAGAALLVAVAVVLVTKKRREA